MECIIPYSFKTFVLSWILASFVPVLCLSAGIGEGCDESNTCIPGLVCSTTTSICECEEPGFKYVLGKCIETPYGDPCSEDKDCPIPGSKCLDKNGGMQDSLLCIAVPKRLQDVKVEQFLDESMKVYFNISWKLQEYTGPTWYIVDVSGKDYTMPTYQYGSVTITKIDATHLLTHEFQFGGWLYKISVTPKTAAGEGPEYLTKEFQSIDSKPGLVQKVEVHQDDSFANQMKLSFECPINTDRNGNITAFIIRKTITTDDPPTSTEYTIPHHFISDKCEIIVKASQVGGIEVLKNYTFEVKIKNLKFEGNFSAPVSLYTNARKPHASTTDFLENLISPYKKKVDKELPSDIDVKLCSSCYIDPVQGPIRAAGLIICVEPCESSFTHLSNESMTRATNSPDDINLYETWATAKATNFSIPYRTTPDGWIQTLMRDNSESYLYTVGSNKNCDEKDKATYCNGPLPYDRNFQIGVLVCNDAGCDATISNDERFNTKGHPDSSSPSSFPTQGMSAAKVGGDDNNDSIILGLAVGLGISLICLCVLIYICLKKSKRGSMEVNV